MTNSNERLQDSTRSRLGKGQPSECVLRCERLAEGVEPSPRIPEQAKGSIGKASQRGAEAIECAPRDSSVPWCRLPISHPPGGGYASRLQLTPGRTRCPAQVLTRAPIVQIGAQVPCRPCRPPFCPVDQAGCRERSPDVPLAFSRRGRHLVGRHAATFTSLCSRAEIMAASMHAIICRP